MENERLTNLLSNLTFTGLLGTIAPTFSFYGLDMGRDENNGDYKFYKVFATLWVPDRDTMEMKTIEIHRIVNMNFSDKRIHNDLVDWFHKFWEHEFWEGMWVKGERVHNLH